MCGVAAVLGLDDPAAAVSRILDALEHRGPDDQGIELTGPGVALGHRRLSIVDLSSRGHQPMRSRCGRFTVAFNGEIYNYRELAARLRLDLRSGTDTEVLLEGWARKGRDLLPELLGMFAFVVWDAEFETVTAVRDRFGVKPLYWGQDPGGGLLVASEIQALHRAGLRREPDEVSWAAYLSSGYMPADDATFWAGVHAVPAGALHEWDSRGETVARAQWYDLIDAVGEDIDDRPDAVVRREVTDLLLDSISLRFRADVPVGINLSGGLDSSLLLALVREAGHDSAAVRAFTFVTGDEEYDELPWVERLLARAGHPLTVCTLTSDAVPEIAGRLHAREPEPLGGVPTLAYSTIFEAARAAGTIVLLDGQGLDESWCGYDYYQASGSLSEVPVVQGSLDRATRPECLVREFAGLSRGAGPGTRHFSDRVRDIQRRDLLDTKIPRALRFNDRVSMAASTELREPFLDHRLVELGLRQPSTRKMRGETGKVLPRMIARELIGSTISLAPKRSVQTPQREWLRGPLRGWADRLISEAVERQPGWFDAQAVESAWNDFAEGSGDNSFFVWQWISIALCRLGDA